MSLIKYPYTNLHELNLDWLIEKVKDAYGPDNPPDMAVLSVNGETGDVILYKEANVQLPDLTDTSWNFFRLADGTAAGIKFNKGLPMERIHGSSRFQVFDTGNPPPYPVRTVNGQTGDITIQVAFGALNGDTVSFLQSSPDHSWSLDRETLDGSASIRIDTTGNEVSAYLEYVSNDDSVHSTLKLLTPADIPSSSGVLSVNGHAGVVVLTASDVQRPDSTVTVEDTLSSLETDTQNMSDKIGNVGNTSLQSQVNTINSKIGTVGNTSLQAQVNALNSQSVYKSNDTIEAGANNAMYAGRVGWSGKQVWFTIPLDKPVASGINTATVTSRGSGTIFLCTANSAVTVGLNDFDVTVGIVQGGRMALSVCFYFNTAPLSITDGIVNVMLNTKFTIKF